LNCRLTDDELALLWELILWNLEVQWRWTLSDSTRDIVVGTVARTEPSSEVTGLTDGDTSQVRADTYNSLAPGHVYIRPNLNGDLSDDIGLGVEFGEPTNHDQPLWLLDSVGIVLWISQGLNLDVLGLLDLLGGSVSDEDWLTTPLDNDL
jgi:hypothetical protein